LAEVVISEFMDVTAVERPAAIQRVLCDPDRYDRREVSVDPFEEGRIAGPALGGFEEEPPAADRRALLADRPNLLLTLRIAGLSGEANAGVPSLIAEEVLRALAHGGPPEGAGASRRSA
jgi:hypothetical protein